MSTTRRIGDVTVLAVDRELTVENRGELEASVGSRLAAGDRKFVLVFEDTRFVDSAGLGALVGLARRVREAGGELRLAGLSEPLWTLFKLTRLDAAFQISESCGAALGEL